MITDADRWLDIDLRQLSALQAIAATGSFHAAADQLGYTQSAVSQQIAALERIVGTSLVYRPGGPRPISLTDAGRYLLRHGEVVLARVRAAHADLAAVMEGNHGSLRVGTYQSVSRRILPRLMRTFADSYPNLEIALTESSRDEDLMERVAGGELDLSFTIFPLPDGPFDAVELFRDPYVLVVPRESPLALQTVLPDVRVLQGTRLSGFRQCRSSTLFEERLRETGMEPNFVFRSDDNGTVQGLVAAGMGMALVPRLTVDTDDPEIAVVALGPEFEPRRIGIAWHRDRYQSVAAQAFIATAQRAAG